MKSYCGYTRRRSWSALFALMLMLASGEVLATDLAAQRSVFTRARQAQTSGDFAQARRLTATLSTYPLQAYLTYEDLRRRLSSVPEDEVLSFLHEQIGRAHV